MNSSPPKQFELPRIRLRPATVADAEAIFEYGSDPIVAHYTDWACRTTIEPLIESIQAREATWGNDQDYSWTLATLAEDRAIGGVRCKLSGKSAEIGFLLNRRFWGQGYAVEAARAVMDWMFSVAEIERVWATCDTENAASIRALEKLGFEREQILLKAIVRPQISPEPRDAYLYRCLRPGDGFNFRGRHALMIPEDLQQIQGGPQIHDPINLLDRTGSPSFLTGQGGHYQAG